MSTHIFQNLTQHGPTCSSIGRVILGNIMARGHFLVLLTPSALERRGDRANWLRREIETAFTNQRNIVPPMLEGFDLGMPQIASQLTGTLAALRHYSD